MKQNSFLNSQYLNNSVKYTAFILYCFSSKLKVVLSRLLRTRKPSSSKPGPEDVTKPGAALRPRSGHRELLTQPSTATRQLRKKTSFSSQPAASSSDWLCHPTPLSLLPFLSSCTPWFNAFPPSLLLWITFPSIPLAKTSLGQIKPAFLLTQILLLSVLMVLISHPSKKKLCQVFLTPTAPPFSPLSSIASSLPVSGQPVSWLPLLRSTTSDLQLGIVWTTSVKGLP